MVIVAKLTHYLEVPWKIVSKSADCPASKPYAVVQKSDGKKAGCHATLESAQKQLAALYANEPEAKEAVMEGEEYRGSYNAAQRKEMAKKGWAMPDGSYPINDATDVKSAAKLAHHSKTYSFAQVKAHITKNAKRLGLTSLLPDDWSGSSQKAVDDDRETRTMQITDVRTPEGEHSSGDGSLTFTGYAAVYGQTTTLHDGPKYRVREVIEPGAFRDVLATNPDVHLLIGHNLDYPLARTGIRGLGGLELRSDEVGLRVFAKLDPEVSYIRDLSRQMQHRVVDQMSFSFKVAAGDDEITTRSLDDGREEDLRRIMRVSQLFDATVTPQGAYPQTSAAIRARINSRTPLLGVGEQISVAPGVEGAETETVAPLEGGQPRQAALLVAFKARTRIASLTHRTKELTP